MTMGRPKLPPRTRTSFFLPVGLKDGLAALKDRDGVPESESVRRALTAYLTAKGIDVALATKEKK